VYAGRRLFGDLIGAQRDYARTHGFNASNPAAGDHDFLDVRLGRLDRARGEQNGAGGRSPE
jgi:hypothetical protein